MICQYRNTGGMLMFCGEGNERTDFYPLVHHRRPPSRRNRCHCQDASAATDPDPVSVPGGKNAIGNSSGGGDAGRSGTDTQEPFPNSLQLTQHKPKARSLVASAGLFLLLGRWVIWLGLQSSWGTYHRLLRRSALSNRSDCTLPVARLTRSY